MNLNQITPGTDYAWFPARGRGEEFRWPDKHWPDYYSVGVHRVKAIRAYSERLPGNKRETGYVEVFMLDGDGEFKLNSDDTHITKTIRVRDIATLWEEYADERDYRQVQRDREEAEREARRQEQQKRWEAEQAERERIRLEREEQERVERERRLEAERIERERVAKERQEFLKRVEDSYGLPPGSVQFNGSSDILILNRELIDAEFAREDNIDTTQPGWAKQLKAR